MTNRYFILLFCVGILNATASSSQSCCIDLEFSPELIDVAKDCDAAAKEIYGNLDSVALIRGARIIRGSNGLHSADVSGFACIHELDLGEDLTLSSFFYPDVNKWVVTIISRSTDGSEDSIAIGDGFLLINRK